MVMFKSFRNAGSGRHKGSWEPQAYDVIPDKDWRKIVTENNITSPR